MTDSQKNAFSGNKFSHGLITVLTIIGFVKDVYLIAHVA